MATDFTIKQHDLLPVFAGICKDADSVVANLTGATVRFIMTNRDTGVKEIDAPAEIVDSVNGIVKYSWAEGDTDIAGTYLAEFEVMFPGNRPETFPNSKNKIIKIFPDLGGLD